MASASRRRCASAPLPLLLFFAAVLLLLLAGGAHAKSKAQAEPEAALHGQTPVMPNPLLTTAPEKAGWLSSLFAKVARWGPKSSPAPSEAASGRSSFSRS